MVIRCISKPKIILHFIVKLNFFIDFEKGTQPISIPSYCMSPAEFKSWRNNCRICWERGLLDQVHLTRVLQWYLWRRNMHPCLCVLTIGSWTRLPSRISTLYLVNSRLWWIWYIISLMKLFEHVTSIIRLWRIWRIISLESFMDLIKGQDNIWISFYCPRRSYIDILLY